jgi:putative transposase
MRARSGEGSAITNARKVVVVFASRYGSTRGVAERIVADGLTSYSAARQRLPEHGSVEHLRVRSAARLNDRLEQSHLPTRMRERQMHGFETPHSAQHFLSLFSRVCNLFRPRRHLLTAEQYRASVQGRFQTWSEITGVMSA